MTVTSEPPSEIQTLIEGHINGFNTQNTELFSGVFGDTAIIIDGIAPYRWLNPNAPASWLADVRRSGVRTSTLYGTYRSDQHRRRSSAATLHAWPHCKLFDSSHSYKSTRYDRRSQCNCPQSVDANFAVKRSRQWLGSERDAHQSALRDRLCKQSSSLCNARDKLRGYR